jgi:succinate dehydrogenase / fumarate reductase, membrane anchor subunit
MQERAHKRSGVAVYIAQRVTAVALVPLCIWFVYFILHLLQAQTLFQLYSALSSPWHLTAAVVFASTSLYHGFLGMREIVEDYIPSEKTKEIVILWLRSLVLGSVFAAVWGAICLFIALSGFLHC